MCLASCVFSRFSVYLYFEINDDDDWLIDWLAGWLLVVPVVEVSPSTQIHAAGSTTTVHCRASGRPQPHISWQLNEQALQSSDDSHYLLTGKCPSRLGFIITSYCEALSVPLFVCLSVHLSARDAACYKWHLLSDTVSVAVTVRPRTYCLSAARPEPIDTVRAALQSLQRREPRRLQACLSVFCLLHIREASSASCAVSRTILGRGYMQ